MRQTSHPSILLCLLAAAFVPGACKDDGGGGAVFGRVEASDKETAEIECACLEMSPDWSSAGYASLDECVDANSGFSKTADRACLEKVWSEGSASEWTSCYAEKSDEYLACIKNRGCPSTEDFSCADGSDTVRGSDVCDGVADCADESDEANCPCVDPVVACGLPPDSFWAEIVECEPKFACASGSEEVPQIFVCDGENDCTDGSDEMNCPMFMCADGSGEVLEAFVCDKEIDCADGSDEANCPGRFLCADASTSIPASWVCDGVQTCDDGSDEANC